MKNAYQSNKASSSPADQKLSVEMQKAWSLWVSFAVPLALGCPLKMLSFFPVWI